MGIRAIFRYTWNIKLISHSSPKPTREIFQGTPWSFLTCLYPGVLEMADKISGTPHGISNSSWSETLEIRLLLSGKTNGVTGQTNNKMLPSSKDQQIRVTFWAQRPLEGLVYTNKRQKLRGLKICRSWVLFWGWPFWDPVLRTDHKAPSEASPCWLSQRRRQVSTRPKKGSSLGPGLNWILATVNRFYAKKACFNSCTFFLWVYGINIRRPWLCKKSST